MKTLAELRKACKNSGIKLKKETLSWGPHVSFFIGGQSISSSGVYTKEFLIINESALNALRQIRKDFAGLTIDEEKVYGIASWNSD